MSPTNINDRLRAAAHQGLTDFLYTLIQENPYVLENIDSIPFVDTPLHVVASIGHLQFATEIMRLKPSFAWKLNQQGFSPIHLAMQQDQKRMVIRLVDINKDLVRVKGREGLTPLHLASQSGDVDLLARFLSACPDSIEDVTMRSETALHVAVKSKQHEALRVLVRWLQINRQKDAIDIESMILNWKDEADNTILHVSALNNFSEAVRLLAMRMNLNAKNLENATALDIAASEEIKDILCASKRAKYGSSVTDAPSLADMLRSNIPLMSVGQLVVSFLRLRSEITEDQRNAFLVVATLVATAAFQTALSPPGGVFQANAGDNNNNNNNNANTTNHSLINFTATTATQGNIGNSIMSLVDFNLFTLFSELSFFCSIFTMYFLTPSGTGATLVCVSILSCFCCYILSLKVVSPKAAGNSSTSLYVLLALLIFLFLGVLSLVFFWYKRLQYETMNREAETRNRITAGKRW